MTERVDAVLVGDLFDLVAASEPLSPLNTLDAMAVVLERFDLAWLTHSYAILVSSSDDTSFLAHPDVDRREHRIGSLALELPQRVMGLGDVANGQRRVEG